MVAHEQPDMRVLQTKRLNLREFTLDDAPFILELLNDPGWIRNIGDRNLRTVDDARHYLQNVPIPMYAKLGFGLWLVERRSDGAPLGMCGLLKRDSLEHVDIGFALLERYRGQGYAFEAASASRDYAFETLGLDRIVAIVSPGNAESVGLLERLGFSGEGLIPSPGNAQGVLLFSAGR